jgi:hypothetical protein
MLSTLLLSIYLMVSQRLLLYVGLPVMVIGLVVVILILTGKWMKNTAKAALAEFEVQHPGQKIVHREGANFFGQQSKGMGQVRGNGLLILTQRKLVFRQFVPSKWFEIPLSWVSNIAHPRSYLGKSKGMQLLVVNYTNVDGVKDAMGWAVNNLDVWTDLINSARGKV